MNDGSSEQQQPHPVAFDVAYPERVSRLSTFFRILLAIPQLIVIYLLSMVLAVLSLVAWFAILFTGRYPKSFFEFSSGVMRWQANVIAYLALLRDEYPPFSWEPGDYPLELTIERAERQSRIRLFIRWFAIIPNYIVFYFVQIGWWVTTIIAWFAILITGRYPRGLHRFSVGVMRWYQRQYAYLYLLRDEYPPYSVNADARPGNEVVSAIIGVPLGAAYFGLLIMFSFLPAFAGSKTVDVRAALLDSPPALEAADLHGTRGNVRITLLGYDETAAAPPGADRFAPATFFDGRLISFDVRAEKDGFLPTFYTPLLFQLDTCPRNGAEAALDATFEDSTPFDVFFTGGKQESTVYFWIEEGYAPCELTYFTGRGDVRFEFTP